jgi:hypothetical protein
MFRMNNEQMEEALSKPCPPDGPVASELSIKSSQTNGQLAQLAKRKEAMKMLTQFGR